MDHPALRRHLAAEAARLQDAAAAADPDATVPACPGWTAADLLDHVTDVYDHKTHSIRFAAEPGGDYRTHRPGTPADRYAGALADLAAAFDEHAPDHPARTWPGAPPLVGFWIRRLTHETLVHRVDAERTAGRPIGPVDAALAADGIDEMLTAVIARGFNAHRDRITAALAGHTGLTVALDTGARSWTVRVGEGTMDIDDGADPGAQALVSADPATVLLWLWRRLPVDAPSVAGDTGRAAALYEVIGAFGR